MGHRAAHDRYQHLASGLQIGNNSDPANLQCAPRSLEEADCGCSLPTGFCYPRAHLAVPGLKGSVSFLPENAWSKCTTLLQCELDVSSADKAWAVCTWSLGSPARPPQCTKCLWPSPYMTTDNERERWYFKNSVFNYSQRRRAIKIMNISTYVSCIVHI